MSWGGGSAGGTDDLLVRMMAAESGRRAANRANYIAFPGGGAALAAVLGGQVTAGVSGYGEFAAQIVGRDATSARDLGASAGVGHRRTDAARKGIALDLANWRGIVAPPGLTDAERDALTSRIEAVARSDEWRASPRAKRLGRPATDRRPFRQFLLAEQQRIEQCSAASSRSDAAALAAARG